MKKYIRLSRRILLLMILLESIHFLHAGPDGRTLKIISYNILNGMKLDETPEKAMFTAWVKKMDPDVLGLQEAQQLTQTGLEEMARKFGHPYAVLLKNDGHPTALTSKFPIVNVRKVTESMHHGFIQAEVAGYNVMVFHLSPHKYWKRREEMDVLLATIASRPDKGNWVLMGDFNAVSPLDAPMYKDGKLVIDRKRAQEKHATHDNLVGGALDFEVISKLLSAGFVDVAQQKARGSLSSQPTRRFAGEDGRGTPRRVDYIFVSRDVEGVMTAGIIKDEFTDMYSDHYPVWLELRRPLP